MPKINIVINEDNILEWVHSTGYFLPRNDREEARFEKLHATLSHNLDIESVDPFAILSGSWQPRNVIQLNSELEEEVSELRMAARKHDDIPDEIFKKMKKNQENDDLSDLAEN